MTDTTPILDEIVDHIGVWMVGAAALEAAPELAALRARTSGGTDWVPSPHLDAEGF